MFLYAFVYLKKPLQPSQVMALKWKPVALSPHTPQILGTFLSNSSGARLEVLTTVDSITKQRWGEKGKKYKEKKEMLKQLLVSVHLLNKFATDQKMKQGGKKKTKNNNSGIQHLTSELCLKICCSVIIYSMLHLTKHVTTKVILFQLSSVFFLIKFKF